MTEQRKERFDFENSATKIIHYLPDGKEIQHYPEFQCDYCDAFAKYSGKRLRYVRERKSK